MDTREGPGDQAAYERLLEGTNHCAYSQAGIHASRCLGLGVPSA